LLTPNQPIGIFDSGIGGLTIAKAIKKELPNEQIIYFGDTLHLPYGDKSANSIQNYALKIASFLEQQNCKIIVIACNSASAVAEKLLSDKYKHHLSIVNVIDPTIALVAKSTQNKKVGLIGTKRTVSTGIYKRKLKKANPNISLFSKATPLLAPMIEEGFFNNKISKTVINSYLANHHLQEIDTLILGCTHYPLINKEIKTYYNGKVNVVDSSAVTAKEVGRKLKELNLLNHTKPQSDIFFVSEYTTGFEKAAKIFFNKSIKLMAYKLFE